MAGSKKKETQPEATPEATQPEATKGASSAQIKFFIRAAIKAGVELDLPSPKANGSYDVPASPADEAAAKAEVLAWSSPPRDPATAIAAAARWIALGGLLQESGVGQAEGTGIGPALDYWVRVRHNPSLSAHAKAKGMIKRAGLEGVASIRHPEAAPPAFAPPNPTAVAGPFGQPVPGQTAQAPIPAPVGVSTMDKALELARSGWAKAEIKALLGLG